MRENAYLCVRENDIGIVMKTRVNLLFAILLFSMSCAAQTANERQARQMFDNIYHKVFGNEGATLHYAVNIIGLYKTEGTIWYKGKKSKFIDEKYDAYNDGVNYWRAERKKKEVLVYSMNDEDRDKYASKFKFEPDNYRYSISRDDKGYWITLTAKKGVKGIKHVKAVIDKTTRAPISLKIKLLWFWTTIKISNFRSGSISDDIFTFPAEKYKNYTFIDQRGK